MRKRGQKNQQLLSNPLALFALNEQLKYHLTFPVKIMLGVIMEILVVGICFFAPLVWKEIKCSFQRGVLHWNWIQCI